MLRFSTARRILDRYRSEIPCFNDDVQGTGCVTLAAMMAGLHVSDLKLTDMRMVVFGSGTAGTGIADQVRDAIATDSGKSKEEAAKQIWHVPSPAIHKILIANKNQVCRQARPSPTVPRLQSNQSPNPLRTRRFRLAGQRTFRPPLSHQRSQTSRLDRHIHKTQSLHPGNCSRNGIARRTTNHLPSLEPNTSPRSRSQGYHRMDERKSAHCDRLPLPTSYV